MKHGKLVGSSERYFSRIIFADLHVHQVDHLRFAKESYEKALKSSEISSDSQVWLEYSKVLMHLGDAESGLKTITAMMRQFDSHDEHQGVFYLTAGAMLSSMGKHEQAGQYYFEAIQIGAPRFFSKSDLMFILSRSFEQLGFETKSSGADPVEEGYIMVLTYFPFMFSSAPPSSLPTVGVQSYVVREAG
jgi:tetratricopeptide (TPR) repeat protein